MSGFEPGARLCESGPVPGNQARRSPEACGLGRRQGFGTYRGAQATQNARRTRGSSGNPLSTREAGRAKKIAPKGGTQGGLLASYFWLALSKAEVLGHSSAYS